MSVESVRARLEAAKEGPWRLDDDKCCVYAPDGDMVLTEMGCSGRNHENAPLAAHTPTDLAAALTVIEAAKAMIATGDGEVRCPNCGRHEHRDDCELLALFLAYEAFEALP